MEEIKNKKTAKRVRRHKKIRAKVSGTSERPRLSVFRSNKYIYAQIIDDVIGQTLIAASTKEVKGKSLLDKATALGAKIAEKAMMKKISTVVFDRGGYLFTGKIKALADGAREGGLKF